LPTAITKKSILNFNGCLTVTAENVTLISLSKIGCPPMGPGKLKSGSNAEFLIQIAKLDERGNT
jgi:hypothetical protein